MGRGRGSIRLKREPDYWEVRAYAGTDPVSGKDRYTSRTVRGGRRDAEKLLAQLVAKLDREGPTTRHTLSELLTSHIDHLEHRGREARTIEGYRSIAAQVKKDRIGKMAVGDIGVKTVDDFYVRLKTRGLAPGSVQRYHALMRAAFRQAMAWDWVSRNPVQLATPPTAPRVGRRIARPDVVAALINEGAASRNPINGLALRLLAATGARRGEICGLRWTDLELDQGVIRIRSAVAQLADGSLVEKEPKSHQQREVSLDRRPIGESDIEHNQVDLAESGHEVVDSEHAGHEGDVRLVSEKESETQLHRLVVVDMRDPQRASTRIDCHAGPLSSECLQMRMPRIR